MTKIATTFLAAAALLIPSFSSAQRSTDLTSKSKSTDLAAKAVSSPVLAPLSVGTAFNASLVDTLDTRRVRPGDPVTAETAEDVNYERTIVFPKGTKILGHIVRATSGGRGRAGSALFVEFDKAVLSSGEEVLLNAGIQALATTSVAPVGDADAGRADSEVAQASRDSKDFGEPVSTPTESNPLVVSADYDNSRRGVLPPLMVAPKAQGELNSDGLFSPDSVGAFGRPDVKVYTPTSQGSHGTVLLSAKKNMHLESGTRLLLVVQPPPNPDLEAQAPPDPGDATPEH